VKEQSLRIAVADDEPVMQMYMQETLEEFGHEVCVVAQDGRELVEYWRVDPPDLIITDIKMPVMDGLAAMREIYRHSTVPVVFVTGYNSLENIDANDEDFVLVFLVKPVGAEDLREAIDVAMRRFGEYELLVEECGERSLALSHRRLVERAKELLMARHGMGEAQAFEYLGQQVREGCASLTAAATAVLRDARCA
jgi:response regulator NasT